MGPFGLGIWGWVLIGLAFVGWVAYMTIKVVREYERLVVFRLGRLLKHEKGPGLVIIIPVIDTFVRVDLRIVTLDVPPQEIITKDNVTVSVNAVAYYRVFSPCDAVAKISNYHFATTQIAQTTLRSVIGQSDLDELLSQRDKINKTLQQIIDTHTDPWGIKVSLVEVKDVGLPETMKRAMAKQAEAERERRAKVIHADGEYQAAKRLTEAADILSSQPISLQLRYLQTISEISTEKSSTILFPIPIEFMRTFLAEKK